jgi:dihydroorotase
VTPAVRFEADIGIRSGRIAAIGAPGELGGSAAEVFEAGGLHVLPGCIDGHVHLREPGLEHKEDIASGTTAAVAGGVTTVLDMPNTLPPTGSAEAVLDKRRRIESSAFCDVGVFGLIGTNNLDQLPRMAEAGVVGFKCFLGETSGGLAPPDDGTLLESLRTSARLGRRTAFHAENSAILQACAQAVRSAGRTDPLAHAEARPVIAEVEAIERVGLLASEAGAPVHIVHLSSRAGLASVRRWRDRGLDMTCETAAQYVFLSVRDMARVGSLLRVNPPLREPEDAEALLHALAHQEITCRTRLPRSSRPIFGRRALA